MICTSNRSKDFQSHIQHLEFQLTQYFRRKWSAQALISSFQTKLFLFYSKHTFLSWWLIPEWRSTVEFITSLKLIRWFEYFLRIWCVLLKRASLKLFNIQITSKDIFIFHYFWYIPSHIHKLQFISNKLRKC